MIMYGPMAAPYAVTTNKILRGHEPERSLCRLQDKRGGLGVSPKKRKRVFRLYGPLYVSCGMPRALFSF